MATWGSRRQSTLHDFGNDQIRRSGHHRPRCQGISLPDYQSVRRNGQGGHDPTECVDRVAMAIPRLNPQVQVTKASQQWQHQRGKRSASCIQHLDRSGPCQIPYLGIHCLEKETGTKVIDQAIPGVDRGQSLAKTTGSFLRTKSRRSGQLIEPGMQ